MGSSNSVNIYGKNHFSREEALKKVLLDMCSLRGDDVKFHEIEVLLAVLRSDAIYYWFRSHTDYCYDSECGDCGHETDHEVYTHQLEELLALLRKVLDNRDVKLAMDKLPLHDHDHVENDDDCNCIECVEHTEPEDLADDEECECDHCTTTEDDFDDEYFEELEVVRKQLKMLLDLPEKGWHFNYIL